MVKACLFDLDGVIIDSESQYTVFWSKIFSEYYPDSDGLAQKIKGQTLVQIYDRYFPDENEQQKITTRLNNFERQMMLSYIPGFEAFMQYVIEHHLKTAVVTSSNKAKMMNVYRQHPHFKQMFNAILTSEDFDESKPSPDCYLKAAQRLDVDPKDCIVFEDSINGLKSGRASGAYVIGLSTTNDARAIAPLADRVISDYQHFVLPL